MNTMPELADEVANMTEKTQQNIANFFNIHQIA